MWAGEDFPASKTSAVRAVVGREDGTLVAGGFFDGSIDFGGGPRKDERHATIISGFVSQFLLPP